MATPNRTSYMWWNERSESVSYLLLLRKMCFRSFSPSTRSLTVLDATRSADSLASNQLKIVAVVSRSVTSKVTSPLIVAISLGAELPLHALIGSVVRIHTCSLE